MLKFLHHAGAKMEMMLPYKIVNNNKRVVCLMSVQYYFHTTLLWPVYYDNWRCYLKNNKKNGAFDLFTCVIFSDCLFLRYFFKKYVGRHVIYLILYIYIKLKLETAKHICLKWVFLIMAHSQSQARSHCNVTPVLVCYLNKTLTPYWNSPVTDGEII